MSMVTVRTPAQINNALYLASPMGQMQDKLALVRDQLNRLRVYRDRFGALSADQQHEYDHLTAFVQAAKAI
jgi:hypothetical protein